MDESLPGNILRTEKVMGTLFRANKARYCPMELDQAKSPVLLTQLRKDAIRHVYSEHYGGNHSDGSNITSFVETAFDVWAQARHDAIPLHLAQSVTDSLRMVQSLREGSSQRIVVGAITDGNANLMVIPELAKFFDFCVHAETVGIGKPDKRVYLHAVARALQHPSLHDLLLDASVAPPGTAERDQVGTVTTTLTEDQCEELAGPWWVHVGDDFVKDIVAAKNLNMRSIWARELIRDQIAGPSTTVTPKNERTVEELVQVLAEMKVVEMQVGADSYLADSLQKEFADAIADEFGSVADILHRWQREATTVVDSSRHSAVRQTGPPMVAEEAVSDQLPPADAKANDSRQPDTKFCIVCGTKLPVAAIFCSACGEKQ